MNRTQLMAAYKKMGKNFMTPRVIAKRVLVSKRTIVELSSGRGFTDEPIFGVSVLLFSENGEREFPAPDESQMFHSLEKAQAHYNEIR